MPVPGILYLLHTAERRERSVWSNRKRFLLPPMCPQIYGSSVSRSVLPREKNRRFKKQESVWLPPLLQSNLHWTSMREKKCPVERMEAWRRGYVTHSVNPLPTPLECCYLLEAEERLVSSCTISSKKKKKEMMVHELKRDNQSSNRHHVFIFLFLKAVR